MPTSLKDCLAALRNRRKKYRPRATDLSGRFRKQTLREWLVLGGFSGRELNKKRLLDPAQVSAGASGAAVALPGEAELHCSNCRLFHQHPPVSTRLCQHIYIKWKLEQIAKIALLYCRDAVSMCLRVPNCWAGGNIIVIFIVTVLFK